MVPQGIFPLAIFPQQTPESNTANSWYGHTLPDEKRDIHTRIMFHNVNHLSLQGVDGLDMFVNEQRSLHVDIQAFSEHCLDTTKFYVNHKAREIIRQQYPGQASLHWNSSTESALNIYKPGGTGLLTLGQIASRLEPDGKGVDPLGRWCYIHLRRHNLPPLTIVSAYQVCPRPTNTLGNTAYHQQPTTTPA